MNICTLDILRCPYCGGRLELVTGAHLLREGDEIEDALLGCHCCLFPVVAGIPMLDVRPESSAAREHLEAGRPDLALRAVLPLQDEPRAAAFDALRRSGGATYRECVEALGPDFEGDYLLYRFTDPSFLVADAVVRAVAGRVLRNGGRALDLCGGSGHVTRALLELSSPSPVLADQSFAQAWLARRFVATGCESVCCDANAPLPFARGRFSFVLCADAFQYIWTKRQLVAEMSRLIDGDDQPGAVVIGHAHNQLEWSPSHGQPLPPDGYADLFETLEARVFGEARLLADVIAGGPLDLARRDPAGELDADPALTIVASRDPDVFMSYRLDAPRGVRGALRISPLYQTETDGHRLRLRLRFPSEFYEEEYGGCRQYLPAEVVLGGEDLSAIHESRLNDRVRDLLRRRIVIDAPPKYC